MGVHVGRVVNMLQLRVLPSYTNYHLPLVTFNYQLLKSAYIIMHYVSYYSINKICGSSLRRCVHHSIAQFMACA